jgi:GH24 family phage-related lysozyme (muramidase)
MKRLWEGMGMAGLIRRREDEAKLCDEAAAAAERA